ncbi:MAG TPA: vgr related protein, partial [Sphingomicrobium sp.]|nr:vgr related protein [Sphingomicrobium sp.]
SDDFSKAPLHLQGFFIHELTHVWQSQTRGRYYLPLMRHPLCRYRYELVPGRPFGRYGLEQQAEIARHIFLAERGVKVAAPPRSLLPF